MQFLLDFSILGEAIQICGVRLLYKDISCIPGFRYLHTGETSAHLRIAPTCSVGARPRHRRQWFSCLEICSVCGDMYLKFIDKQMLSVWHLYIVILTRLVQDGPLEALKGPKWRWPWRQTDRPIALQILDRLYVSICLFSASRQERQWHYF